MIQMPVFEKIERRKLFALGCLLGAAVFFLLYGFAPLDVTNDAWLRGGYIEADILQHYAGWLFYRQSELSVPFCFSELINWPFGLSVAFTDSVPLFAALFRLLEPLLPATFQYFGLFTLLCFVLQGGFACLLVGLFTRRLPAVLLGAVPFVFSPILLERAFRHTALAAQFLAGSLAFLQSFGALFGAHLAYLNGLLGQDGNGAHACHGDIGQVLAQIF